MKKNCIKTYTKTMLLAMAFAGLAVLGSGCQQPGDKTGSDNQVDELYSIEFTSNNHYAAVDPQHQMDDMFLVNINIGENDISGNGWINPDINSVKNIISQKKLQQAKEITEALKSQGQIINESKSPYDYDVKIDFDRSSSNARSASNWKDTWQEPAFALDQTKDWYGSTPDEKIDNVNAASSVLKAIGEHCYVWYKDAGSSEIELENNIFNIMAECFDAIYEKETYMFGSNVPKNSVQNSDEYDNIYIHATENTKINILVYDLYGDVDVTSQTKSGTFGYFRWPDLIKNSAIPAVFAENNFPSSIEVQSNEIQCIHIDSYFLSIAPAQIILTLAHEFQHMLNYVNKSINYDNGRSATWYNEMMSMVCEDLMATQLDITNPKATPIGRLDYFNCGHELGFKVWRSGEAVFYSYANAYAFGAFLMRNFGIDMIKSMAHNKYINEKSVAEALKATDAPVTSFNKALEKFSHVILTADKGYTLNKSVSKTYKIKGKNVTFNCPAIDLKTILTWDATQINSHSYLYGSEADTPYYGPEIYYRVYAEHVSPTGIQVQYIGYNYASIDLDGYDFKDRKVLVIFK